MEKAREKIVIVGCGNVAWHLAKKLSALKKYSIFVYNHQENPLLDEFSAKFGCRTQADLKSIRNDAAFYFICVSDKYVRTSAEQITSRNPSALLMHTSGSIKIAELGKRVHETGVFYPVQTFSRHVAVNWKEIPLILETSEKDETRMRALAKLFGGRIIFLPYRERLKLHLTAVLVNNFTNALYVEADDLLTKEGDPLHRHFDLLLPLIRQTTLKIETVNPRAAQTGPARRNDVEVMKKHLHLLGDNPELKKVYKQMSKLILKQQQR